MMLWQNFGSRDLKISQYDTRRRNCGFKYLGKMRNLQTWGGGVILSEYIIFGENNHKWDNDGFFSICQISSCAPNKIFFKSCSHFALQVKRCCAFMNLYETFCEESHNYIGSLLRSLQLDKILHLLENGNPLLLLTFTCAIIIGRLTLS